MRASAFIVFLQAPFQVLGATGVMFTGPGLRYQYIHIMECSLHSAPQRYADIFEMACQAVVLERTTRPPPHTSQVRYVYGVTAFPFRFAPSEMNVVKSGMPSRSLGANNPSASAYLTSSICLRRDSLPFSLRSKRNECCQIWHAKP